MSAGPETEFVLRCCCICGQRLTWVGDQLHCPDHYEVNEAICDSLNEPGWRDTMICASDEPPLGFPPRPADAPPLEPLPERPRKAYWLHSGRHG